MKDIETGRREGRKKQMLREKYRSGVAEETEKEKRRRLESTGREREDEVTETCEKRGEKSESKRTSEANEGSAASASFHLSFLQSIVSKSHFPANLEASKIHSTLYLKP